MMIEKTLLSVLAFIGLLISTYFQLVSRNKIASDAPFIPAWCRMESSACASIVSAKEARLFGIPNFELGSFFYLLMLTATFMELPPTFGQALLS